MSLKESQNHWQISKSYVENCPQRESPLPPGGWLFVNFEYHLSISLTGQVSSLSVIKICIYISPEYHY